MSVFPRMLSLTVGGVMCGALTLAALSAPTAAQEPGQPAAERRTTTPAGQSDRPGPTRFEAPDQTSDGKPAWIAKPLPAGAKRVPPVVTSDTSWEIVPGVVARQWDQTDFRGPIRAYLLSVDLAAPGVSVDYLSSRYTSRRKPVSQLATAGVPAGTTSIGAVNGDFFDISDTGAPLGVGVDPQRGLLNAPRQGWVSNQLDVASGTPSLYLDTTGAHVGTLSVKAKIRQHPRWKVTNVNSPTIASNGIGLYTSDWGWTKGRSWTDGQKHSRQVTVVDGKVVDNRPWVTKGKKIRGQVLVGRGSAAKLLKGLRVGQRVTFKSWVPGNPTMAISGDRPILVDGVRTVIDDTSMHPRTAVGIDADTNRLLVLVVDGRQDFSRGYTMVELATMMTALGAENAINLDGGGSTTMYTRRLDGLLGVLNSPSDGVERNVPNGLGISYTGVLPATPPIPTVAPTPTPTTPTPTKPRR